MMFDVQAETGLPMEYVEVSSIWVRRRCKISAHSGFPEGVHVIVTERGRGRPWAPGAPRPGDAVQPASECPQDEVTHDEAPV